MGDEDRGVLYAFVHRYWDDLCLVSIHLSDAWDYVHPEPRVRGLLPERLGSSDSLPTLVWGKYLFPDSGLSAQGP